MANIQIQSMVLGMVGTNVFLVKNEDTGELVIIDPADGAGIIEQKIRGMGGRPVAILLTHGHFDHIMACEEIRDLYSIPVYAEESEAEVLEDPRKNLSADWGSGISMKADHYVKDGDVLTLAGLSIHVLHTPGHTQGSCCFYLPEEKLLFSGDTLFCGSYGRIDFPTSSGMAMKASVQRLLRELPDDTNVLPGHEMFTRIDQEKRYNPLAP
ncbi:MAG: MBL fold metallo-hydrolase [Lachnospiraceae bacterium]|nr:MBL fold metallo-hydrolase [Lachnospiraceae bacterium]